MNVIIVLIASIVKHVNIAVIVHHVSFVNSVMNVLNAKNVMIVKHVFAVIIVMIVLTAMNVIHAKIVISAIVVTIVMINIRCRGFKDLRLDKNLFFYFVFKVKIIYF